MTATARMTLALAASTAACGSRSTATAADAAAAADAPPAITVDASDCDLGPPAAASRVASVTVTMDVPVAFMRPTTPRLDGGVIGVFADASGIAVFGAWEFVRLTAAGAQTAVVAYPPRLADGRRYELLGVARGTTRYGLVMVADLPWQLRFCTVGASGSLDPLACVPVESVESVMPRIGWSGSTFDVDTLVVGSPTVLRRTSFSEDGVPLGQQDLLTGTSIGPLSGVVATDGVVGSCILAPHGEGCGSAFLGLASSGEPFSMVDLLPPGATIDIACSSAGGSGTFASIVGRRCAAPGTCSSGGPSALAVVFASTTGVVSRRTVLDATVSVAHRIVWDGASFVVVESQARDTIAHVFDPSGAYQARTGPIPLANVALGLDRIGAAALSARGPNDYLFAYTYRTSSLVEKSQVAAFSISP